MAPVPQHKVVLDESEMPTRWYNILADLPTPPPPPLHPGTGLPVGPEDLSPIFPMDLILQEVSTERYIDIPEEVQDVYRLWRPSPLIRALRLEKALGRFAGDLLDHIVRRQRRHYVKRAGNCRDMSRHVSV